jgi:hypothetical protein
MFFSSPHMMEIIHVIFSQESRLIKTVIITVLIFRYYANSIYSIGLFIQQPIANNLTCITSASFQ